MKARLKAIALVASPMLMVSMTAACSGGGSDDDSTTVELKLATYTGPQSGENTAFERWIELVSDYSDGSIDIELFDSGSLVAADDMLPAVRDSRTDIAAASYAYHPDDFPLSHIVNVPFRTDNVPADARAFYDLSRNDEQYVDEFDSAGVTPLFHWITAQPLLGCTEPVTSLDDLKGRSIRAVGLTTFAWEALGMNVAAIPFPEVRESAERGLIDCWTAITMDTAVDGGLQEVTPYVYDAGYMNFGTFLVIMNKDTWESLSDDQRDAMTRATETLLDEIPEITDESYAKACDVLRADTEVFEEWSQAMQDGWREAVGSAVMDQFLSIADKAGKDGADFFDAYEAALETAEAQESDYVSAVTRCIDGDL